MTLTREEYEAKRQARYDRLIAAAERAQNEGLATSQQGREMFGAIPFGQPILIGHHSEKWDRNYRARADSKVRRGWELQQKAEEYRSRASSIENNHAIFSDDPDAPEKLQEKITKLETLQETYKKVNAAYKKFVKDPASLDKSDLPESTKKLIREWQPQYSFEHAPIQPYVLTNNNANIRRLKERLETVSRKQAAQDTERTAGDIKIEYCPGENRIRIHYPARVSKEVYQSLRSAGYRVAPSFGDFVFSAYHNNSAKWFADQIKEEVTHE